MKSNYTTEDISSPSHGSQVRCKYYWWCENSNPQKAVFYIGADKESFSPQCNSQEGILSYYDPPYQGCEIVFMEVAYLPAKYVQLQQQ